MPLKNNTDRSKRKVVIWGAGGHALVVADIYAQTGDFAVSSP